MNQHIHGLAYHIAPWLYMLAMVWLCVCLYFGHRSGKINLWDCVTTTKGDKTFTDSKKLAYIGTFVVMAIGFAFLALTDRLTEWYATIFVAAFITGKFLGDREQRLHKEIEVKGEKSNETSH